jgi:hypothetical protein
MSASNVSATFVPARGPLFTTRGSVPGRAAPGCAAEVDGEWVTGRADADAPVDPATGLA